MMRTKSKGGESNGKSSETHWLMLITTSIVPILLFCVLAGLFDWSKSIPKMGNNVFISLHANFFGKKVVIKLVLTNKEAVGFSW